MTVSMDALSQSFGSSLSLQPERQLTILYGTQTGTSEDIAHTISRLALGKHLSVTLSSLSSYDPSQLISESLILIIISTTGQGDFPTSSLPFWNFLLRDGLPTDILSDLQFAVFGLGDSSYARYNWPARKLRRRLKDLGAREVVQGGEGDDQHYLGVEGTLLPWLKGFWAHVDEVMPLPDGVQEIPEGTLLPPKVTIEFLQEGTTVPNPQAPEGYSISHLTANTRITSKDHFQDVRFISLETTLPYKAGDVAYLLPSNPSLQVTKLLSRLGWTSQADLPLLTPLVPYPTTLRLLLTYHLDPFSVPRRSFFDFIRLFSPPTSLEREKLDEFMQPGEGADEMYEYAMRVRRTMAEVLYEFQSVVIGPEWVGELFPRLRERAFSIASSPGEGKVELAVALVKYKTRLKDMRLGVCSRWLDGLQVASEVWLRITKGTMSLPQEKETPIVLVGPGTGIAPLRSFVNVHPGHKLLFAGCRFTQKDSLFKSEFEKIPNLHYILAPSRDGDQVYVQDRIRQHADKVWDIIGNKRGFVYVCGSSGKMPEQVRQAVKFACIKQGEMDEDQAERYLATMETQRRWQEECWS